MLWGKVIVLTSLFVAGCSTSFMDKALVGDINGKRIVVFKHGEYYRPQFDSECPINRNGETYCNIPVNQLVNVHPYKEHIQHGDHPNSTKPQTKNHVYEQWHF